jgi:hypothetical protein
MKHFQTAKWFNLRELQLCKINLMKGKTRLEIKDANNYPKLSFRMQIGSI